VCEYSEIFTMHRSLLLLFTLVCVNLGSVYTETTESQKEAENDGVTESQSVVEGAGAGDDVLSNVVKNVSAFVRLLPDENINDNALYNDLDTWEAPYEIRKEYPYFLAGYTQENLPVWGMELGKWNLKKMLTAGGETLKTFDKYVDQMAYRMLESLKAKSTPEDPITDIMFLVDFDGLQLEQVAHLPSMTWLINLARTYRDLIAKHLGGTTIVNANFVAENLVNILRPVFGHLLEKVEVYGTNRRKWLPHIIRKYDTSVLPEYYGGSASWKPLKVYG